MGNPDLQAKLRALRLEYLDEARQRAQGFAGAAAALPAGRPDDEALEALRLSAHRLRGSGGFYGFAAISAAAADLEDAVVAVLSGEEAYDGTALGALAGHLARAIRESRLPD